MLARLTVAFVFLAVVMNTYQEVGPWGSGALLVVFMMASYLDNQVRLLRHELRLAKHNGGLHADTGVASNKS